MTTSGTPTYAYVKYHDGAKAIVHISLIKQFAPSSVDELSKRKMVYWGTKTSQRAKYDDEDFYMADIAELGGAQIRRKAAVFWKLQLLGKGVSRPSGVNHKRQPDQDDLYNVKAKIVHLGNGVWVDKERWDLLLGRDRDSLFCKELAKLVWGVPAVRGRSVTGAPCRHFLKEGNAVEKPALSPHKLEAVDAFDAFLSKNGPTTQELKPRRGKLNPYLADMLRDIK
ncbi:hypothetical protein MTO96_000531 [Rhipicephalus appendiculatus]